MLIKALMLSRENLVTVTPCDTLKTALQKINERNFLSIPVVEGTKFHGIISKEKIFEEFFELNVEKKKYLEERKVSELIREDIPVLNPKDEIEKASHALEIYGTPFVAVIDDDGIFEGIVTHYAIFQAFTDAVGINRGSKIEVIAYDIPGQIAKLTEIIARFGGDIISFVVLDPKVKTDVKEIVVRIRADNVIRIVDAIRNAGFRVQ